MTVWLNGAFIDSEAKIDARDRGFLLSDGVFETIYVEDGAPSFLNLHLTRLRDGLDALGILQAVETREIGAVIAGLAERNGLAAGLAAARLTVSRGPGPRGLAPPEVDRHPTLLLTLAAYKPPTSALRLTVGAARRYSGSIAARHKTLAYLDNVLARREALRAGADEAVMLNEHGRVAGASAANIFVIGEDGAVATPPVGEGALPGVARGVLIAAAAHDGLGVEERPIMVKELQAGALALTNSLIGVAQAGFDDSAGPAPPVLKMLQSCYARALAEDFAAIRGAR